MTGRRRKERAGSEQFLLERQLNFPHAGVQHAIVGSATFLRYWGELGQVHPNRVFVHFGDSDVVSLTNPRGGNSQSVFDHFTEVISRSHPSEGGFSALVRLGGAVAYSTDEIDTYLVEAGYLPPQAFGGEPSPLAKFNALLAQANQLIAAELATGDYPVGYFLEPNTLINADYLGPLRTSDGNTTDGLLPAMSQLSATRARGFANTYAVHRRLRELRLHKRPHSRFLGRREAQVQTSTRGARRTYVWKHLHEVADEVTVTDEVAGEVARWVPKFPGRTLFVLGAKQLATNFTFNPTRLLATLGSLTGLGSREKVKELFDPDRRAAALARLDPTRRRETARKLVAMYKVNSRVETLMSDGLTGTLDELFDYLRRYGEQPDPDWYVNELDRFGDTAARTPHVDLDLSDLDASDSDVDLPDVDLPAVEAGSGARRQTRSVSPGPEPPAALDDVLADLLRGLRLADDPPTADPRTAPDGDAMDIDDVHGPAGDGVVDVDAVDGDGGEDFVDGVVVEGMAEEDPDTLLAAPLEAGLAALLAEHRPPTQAAPPPDQVGWSPQTGVLGGFMPAEAQIGAAVRAGLVPHTVDGVGDGLLTALAATDPDLIIARLDLPQPGPDLPPHPGTLTALYDRLRHEHGQVPEPGMMAWLLGTRIDLIESDGAVTPVPAPDGLVDPPTLTLLRVTDAAAGSRYHATQPLGLPLDTLDAAWVQHTLDTLSATAAAEHWAQSIEDFRDHLTRLGYTDLATTPPIAVYHLALRLIAFQRAAATPPTPTTLTDPAVWTTQPPTPHPAPDRTLEHPPITRTFTADGHGEIPGITLAGEPVTMGAAAAHRQVTLHLGPRDDTTLAAHAAITDRKGTTWYHTLNPPTPHEYQTIKTHGTVWSKPVDPNAIPGHGKVSKSGALSVAGQPVQVGLAPVRRGPGHVPVQPQHGVGAMAGRQAQGRRV